MCFLVMMYRYGLGIMYITTHMLLYCTHTLNTPPKLLTPLTAFIILITIDPISISGCWQDVTVVSMLMHHLTNETMSADLA